LVKRGGGAHCSPLRKSWVWGRPNMGGNLKNLGKWDSSPASRQKRVVREKRKAAPAPPAVSEKLAKKGNGKTSAKKGSGGGRPLGSALNQEQSSTG